MYSSEDNNLFNYSIVGGRVGDFIIVILITIIT